jgi:DNA-binding transcriptional regulator LsrR (DeoR family)
MAKTVEAVPDDVTDLIVRAAWLYYVGANNQERTAEMLGITRTKVTRLLSQARELGLVKISIEHELSTMLEVEDRIRDRFGLSFCIATPPALQSFGAQPSELGERHAKWFLDSVGRSARRAVGIAAARYLRGRLEKTSGACVGVGWGRTLAEVADQMASLSEPGLKFVSLMGSLTRSAAANPYEVVHRLANRTGGEAYFLPVPFIADSEEDRRVLLSQRGVRESLALARAADFYVVSLGECDEGSLIYQSKLISKEDLAALQRCGAVGDTVGKFFDAEGRLVDSEINARTLGVDLEDLMSHEVVLVSGGPSKFHAVKALLKSGMADGLIVDGDVAQRLAVEA